MFTVKNRITRGLLFTAIASAIGLSSAAAATRTWNPSGNGNFNDPTNWGGTAPGASDTGSFNAASVNGPQLTAPITVGSINFTSTGTGYDLTASSTSNILTLMSTGTTAGNSALAVQVAGSNTIIDAPLNFGAAAAATQQISNSGNGILILNGPITSTNSITLNYSGGGNFEIHGSNSNTGNSVQTNNSTISIFNSAAFGTSTVVFAASSGALAPGSNLTGANAINNALVFSNASPSTLNLNNILGNAFEFGGTLDLGGAARTIAAKTNSGVTFDNVISNDAAGGLTITTSNSSNVTLKGLNTYTGITTTSGNGAVTVSNINNTGFAGNLGMNSVIRLGSATNAGALNYIGAGETTDRSIDLGGTTGGATISTTGATGALVVSGGVTASGAGAKTLTLRGNSAPALVNAINGVIADSSSGATLVTKRDTGTWSLGGLNTYTGTTTVNEGTLVVNTLGLTGTASSVGEAATVALGSGNNTVVLNYVGAGETTDHTFDLAGSTGSVTIDTSGATGALTITGNITASGAGSKVLTLAGSNNLNAIQGTISNNSVANTTSLVKTGNGSWILSGANTYSGGTLIRNGTLAVSSIGLAGSAGNLGTNGTINIGNGGQSGALAYTGAGETTDRVVNLSGAAGGATIDTSNSTGALIFTSNFTATGAGAKTLTLKGGNNDEIQGAIVDSGGGATSLSKINNGTWSLSGANSYSGGTTVTAGTLRLSGPNVKLGIGDVFVLSNGLLNITAGAGASNMDGTIADTATLDLTSSGPAVVKLGNSVNEVVGALKLGGVTQGNGTYGSSTSGAMFVDDTYFNGNGIITVGAAVPEPSVFGLVLAGSGLLVGAQRFRRRRE